MSAKSGQLRFDDLPSASRGKVNVNSALLNRPVGTKPALGPDEIDAIVAFLRMLSDRPPERATGVVVRQQANEERRRRADSSMDEPIRRLLKGAVRFHGPTTFS